MGNLCFRMVILGVVTITGCVTSSKTLLLDTARLPHLLVPESIYVKLLGESMEEVKREPYLWIPDALKVRRVKIFDDGKNYIFEIHTADDIDWLRRCEGYMGYKNRVQFQITILVPEKDALQIFTTQMMDEAVLVKGDCNICYASWEDEETKEERVIAVWCSSNYEELARLKVKIEKEIMRIHLPKKHLPRWTDEQHPKDARFFTFRIASNYAKPPFKPLPTNLPDVFFMPEFCSFSYMPSGSAYWGDTVFLRYSPEHLKKVPFYLKTPYYDDYFKNKKEK